ncbi:dihydrolipoyl dehydrogenase [Rhodoblastus acidophilus]|uniref:Dihydrolipoyl dehydrogenase n=1 Tax=Candidatus Rhodoblastus alkanivorans TaxID=2954117 RepID=A0ABS9Z6V7_9HYPH|nr:dihydrolipoyl dehydrogenase [Candidatus Rhodoblastus alkanivorans]MCI4680740.1 dihydrolipoyl dehydrogenase [Candidatus Rhodoblastus alkanivorans]MCI4683351.1 dihydrolipoyl dehydrogenase [Candidatus Rhodoblastus alkanivorans]MDI4640664.1 dihydrolipoyl dehydrogenase [Rhodoblastus acidophilus]
MTIEIKVPDIGDFKDVPIIEILVKAGDMIKPEDPLIVLESDKATMEVPSPSAGVVKELKVKVGDRVGEGALILLLDEAGAAAAVPAPAPAAAPAPAPSAAAGDLHAEVLVLGAGPGGYTAAFRAADLGARVVLVERWPVLGGVCLNVGCIPSKALLHAAKVIEEAHEIGENGIVFADPTIDLDKLRGWKESVVKLLTGGLGSMAKQRKVTVVTGKGAFASPNSMEVIAEDGSKKLVTFDKAIIAAGSEPVTLPFIPHDDSRVIDSTGALALADVPKRLLVLGGGIIGLEMATVYHALGSKVTVVELMDQIIPGADKDIVAPLAKRIGRKYEKVLLKTKVVAVAAEPAGLRVTFEAADGAQSEDTFDKLLVAVGRKPNGKLINAEAAGLNVDERGFIAVDKQMRTKVPHVFAIGDIVGQPMLAHKATHEAKVAAEVACGHKSVFDAKVIPSVAYTDPEVAWVGVTETEAKAKGLKFGKATFPWAASGRALSLGRDEGATKVLFDEETKRLIGCGIVGVNAGDLIAEAALAIEMSADAEDIGLTIHPHPTLSETLGMAAELFEGTITDLIPPKKN